jgi:hypothetical protein
MSSFPFVQQTGRIRADPLSAQRLNQAHSNIEAVDRLSLVEHFASGKHNALEVPWVLGFMVDGAPPTGFLFDTEYGGGTLTRPSTGLYTVSVASGVVTTSTFGYLEAAAMANVADTSIEAKPHIIAPEFVSATSIQFRVRALSSALGAGNTWADANRNICVGLHALRKAPSTSLLGSRLEKQRRNFLTDQATDWNALVQNQGIARKASLVEHTSTGKHNANRIAKAAGWFRPSGGSSFAITSSDGVASVSRVSLGVVEVTLNDNFTNLNTMACFPEGQPASKDELTIINGRGFNTGAGTSRFRFYIYAYSGGNWARADRAFFTPMFGVIA